MADAGGLQLLPETRKKIEVRVPGQNKFLVLGFVFVVIILILYLGLLSYKSSLNSTSLSLDSQLAGVEKARDVKGESQILNLSQQLAIVNPLLSGHFVWSDAFARIQRLTLPQTQYESVIASVNGNKYLYKAFAANYTTVAKQIAAFYSDDAFTDINLDKVSSLPTGRVEFTLELLFKPNKFILNPK